MSLAALWLLLLAPTSAPTSAPLDTLALEAGPRPSGDEHELEETTITGRKRVEATANTRFDIALGDLHIIPRRSAAEQLMLAPGVLTTNHGGEGHAHQTFMRGFAAGEGQDIEYLVDGVPLNEISNAHGHGYADLHFIPPELVANVVVDEGPFDPAQGDFAFAGSAEYKLGVHERGARLIQSLGAYQTHRTLLILAPPDEADTTFAAFELYDTAGFGPNRAASRASAIGRYADEAGPGGLDWSVTTYAYAGRFDQAGVLRQDDLQLGRVGFFDTYDPNQGGESSRLLLSFNLGAGPQRARWTQVTFLGWRAMRLRVNFTGWLNDQAFEDDGTPIAAQRGDGLEMRYGVFTGGARGHYTLQRRAWSRDHALSFGYALRFDQGDSKMLRLRAVTAIPYSRVFDRGFTVLNLSGWTRGELAALDWLTARGGLRLDAFSFGVLDNLQPTADREGPREPDQMAQSFGFALNPRLTLDGRLTKGVNATLSYGQATRSTEAAALSDNETAPFARANELEAGLTAQLGEAARGLGLHLKASYVLALIDKDLLFNEAAGRNEIVGASTRHAGLGSARLSYDGWLDLLANLGWAHATLDETGELLPYIPEWVGRLDAAIKGPLGGWSLGGVPVTGRLGLGFTWVPGAPLPFQEKGDPFYLLNAGADLRLWHTSWGLEARNLLDRQYRQSEFNYASNWLDPSAPPTRVPARHFAAGEPRFVMLTLTLHVEALLGGGAPEHHRSKETHTTQDPQDFWP
ncbi:TonB-dependent receptor plug domain-containing protein [Myxococcota bacterium]|nr:TonB-dependent receptor plug domain-containing protein [Myxococcota bacterium]MBU1430856.1 TonB-dependent receptor plug domain-containing protein [Myxococcota bacterium]MBU1899031.1 TonB-dependent receptor plug domain-containing protein [Myxococcota bacterium]